MNGSFSDVGIHPPLGASTLMQNPICAFLLTVGLGCATLDAGHVPEWTLAATGCPESAASCLVTEGRTIPLEAEQLLHLADGRGFSGRVARIAGTHGEWSTAEEWGARDTYLLSAVGPMISTLHVYEGEHGVGGWVDQYVEVERLGGYAFSLTEHLTTTGQLEAQYAGWELERFWVVGWNGTEVELGVQIHGCENVRSSCYLEVAHIVVVPPAEWTPWLNAAQQGQGWMMGKGSSSCSQHLECGWGHRCDGDLDVLQRGAGTCVEAECHEAGHGLPARSCAAPQSCAYEDGFSIENGIGYCEAS
jgi:hypothetical protein